MGRYMDIHSMQAFLGKILLEGFKVLLEGLDINIIYFVYIL